MAKRTATKPASDAAVIDINKPLAIPKEVATRRDIHLTAFEQLGAIDTADKAREAATMLAGVAKTRRWVTSVFKLAKDPLNDALNKIRGNEKTVVSALEDVESKLTKGINYYRRADEQRRLLAAQAETAAREEAARAEAQARAEELRQMAAGATKAVARQLNQQADIIANAQPIVDPVEPEPEAGILGDGQHDRGNYHAAVDSKDQLILQVAAQAMIAKHGAPPVVAAFLQQFKPNAQATTAVLQPHMPELNQLAKRLRNELALAGVRAVKDEAIITRG